MKLTSSSTAIYNRLSRYLGVLSASWLLFHPAPNLAAPQHLPSQAQSEAQLDQHQWLLGVGPFLPPKRLELTFGHMAARFSEALGHRVLFRTSSTHARYAERLRAEEFDFAVVPPFLFVQLDDGAYVPLARAPRLVRGELLVLEGSLISELNDLRGEILAIGPRDSGVDRLGAYMLQQHGFDLERDLTIRYFDGPLSCVQQILAGTAAACVTNFFARERFQDKMNVRLKVIGETPPVPYGPFVVHRRVPHPFGKS